MKNRFFTSVAALLVGGGLATAQMPMTNSPYSGITTAPVAAAPVPAPAATPAPLTIIIPEAPAAIIPAPALQVTPPPVLTATPAPIFAPIPGLLVTPAPAPIVIPGSQPVIAPAPAASPAPPVSSLPEAGTPQSTAAAPAGSCMVPDPGPCNPHQWDAATASSTCDITHCDANQHDPRFWTSAEYLLWRVKNGPLPVPLVTTNPNAAGTIGTLTEPGTSVLFGGANNDLNYKWTSGGRVAVGGWLDPDSTIGFEFGGFLFGDTHSNFSASSAGGLAPIISIPFNATQPFNFNPPGETTLNAGNTPNIVTVTSESRLWGAEANNVFNLANIFNLPKSQGFQLVGLAGVRDISLDEKLGINDTFYDSATNGTLSVTDSFQTRNEFYGGQIGVRGGMNFGSISVEAGFKCAFGVDNEFVNINGSSVVTNGAFGFPTGGITGGVFAQNSNIGQHATTVFAVAPEAMFRLGYDVTENVRFTIGYDFLYISDVARPGDQVNRNINPTQNLLLGGGVVSGTLVPVEMIKHTDFWAQGFTVGVQVRY